MKFGFIGLGRMGLALVEKLSAKNQLVVFDQNPRLENAARAIGAQWAANVAELARALPSPRIVWMMVPMGRPVDDVIEAISPHLEPGDIIVDGGNADFRDSIRRREELGKRGVRFAGAGTSGGIEGARSGPPITADGTEETLQDILPILEAAGGNYSTFSKSGQGHLAKTIHNAIEYGMMQSLAEGVALYEAHGFTPQEIRDVFKTWSKGSIIESRLVNCLNDVLAGDGLAKPAAISVSETVKIVEGALLGSVPTPAIREAIRARREPASQSPLAITVLARLRNHFGGHAIKTGDEALR